VVVVTVFADFELTPSTVMFKLHGAFLEMLLPMITLKFYATFHGAFDLNVHAIRLIVVFQEFIGQGSGALFAQGATGASLRG
jgi:hypothetical protein